MNTLRAQAVTEELEFLSQSPIFRFMFHYSEDMHFNENTCRITSEDIAELGRKLVREQRMNNSNGHTSSLEYLRLLVKAADQHEAKMENDRVNKRSKRKAA